MRVLVWLQKPNFFHVKVLYLAVSYQEILYCYKMYQKSLLLTHPQVQVCSGSAVLVTILFLEGITNGRAFVFLLRVELSENICLYDLWQSL